MLSIPAVNRLNSAEFRTIYQRRIVTRTEMRLRQLSIRSRFAISCSQSVLPRFLHVPRDAHSSPSFGLSTPSHPSFIRPLISSILSSIFLPLLFTFYFILQMCRAKFSNLNSGCRSYLQRYHNVDLILPRSFSVCYT